MYLEVLGLHFIGRLLGVSQASVIKTGYKNTGKICQK